MLTTLFTRISQVPIRYRALSTSQPIINAQRLRQKTCLAHNYLCQGALNKHDNDISQANIWLQTRAFSHGVKINFISKRFKTKSSKPKNRGPKKPEEDEEEENDDDGEEENPLLMDELTDQPSEGSQRMVLDVGSLRLDAVGKMAFAVTRLKMEELFYKGDLYINGVRATKKGQDLNIGDEVDLVKQMNTEDRSKVDVKRFVILKMPDKATEQGRMKITIDRWLDLTIDMPEDKVK